MLPGRPAKSNKFRSAPGAALQDGLWGAEERASERDKKIDWKPSGKQKYGGCKRIIIMYRIYGNILFSCLPNRPYVLVLHVVLYKNIRIYTTYIKQLSFCLVYYIIIVKTQR